MAVRYDQKKKDEVVAFIEQYNSDNGRGGQAAAAKKYKLNPITIKSWLEKAGVKTPGKSGKKKKGGKRGPKKGTQRSTTSVASSGGDDITSNLKRMTEIQGEIAKLNSEYEKLKNKI